MSDRPDEKNVIVCRCEDVTLHDLRSLLAERDLSMEEVKRLTRCTMGPCQGRTCRSLVAQEMAAQKGISVGEVVQPGFRPPTKPIKLGVLADAAAREQDPQAGQSREG